MTNYTRGHNINVPIYIYIPTYRYLLGIIFNNIIFK